MRLVCETHLNAHIYVKYYGNEKAAPKGGLIMFSNALLLNHLSGADTRSRTRDLLITSQLLYQLSYVGASRFLEILIELPLS